MKSNYSDPNSLEKNLKENIKQFLMEKPDTASIRNSIENCLKGSAELFTPSTNALDFSKMEVEMLDMNEFTVNLMPIFHNLSQEAQIDIFCKMNQVKKEWFDFTFDEEGFMSVSFKEPAESVHITVKVDKEGCTIDYD